MKKNKLLGLQILRGLAAWIVVFYHINQSYFNFNPPFDFLKILEYGRFGVDIFFVLSGFIMYNSVKYTKRGGFSFLLDRIFRIFPIYWLMTFLLIIFTIILPIESYRTSFTWDTLLKSLFLFPCENPKFTGFFPFLIVGWTLTFEMFFYSILSISLYLNKKLAIIIAILIISILSFILGDIEFLGNSNALLYEFVFGVLIAHVYTTIESSKNAKILINPRDISLLVIIIFIYSYLVIKYFGFIYPVKLSVAGFIVVVFLLLENIVRKFPRLQFFVVLGDISYSTYIIHPLIMGWFKVIFLNANQEIVKYSIIIIFLFLVYYLSNLSYRYVEVSRHLLMLKEKIKASIELKLGNIYE